MSAPITAAQARERLEQAREFGTFAVQETQRELCGPLLEALAAAESWAGVLLSPSDLQVVLTTIRMSANALRRLGHRGARRRHPRPHAGRRR